MKKERKHQTNGNGQLSQRVHWEFNHPTATAVSIAGTFNDWRPEATAMVAVGDGCWRKEIILPPGSYEYLFVADGNWMPDPLARATVANPFGGVNSLLTIPHQQSGVEG
jgi:1,4-alpha-glucan branching enzyme